VVVLIYIPTSSVWGFLFPHILANICCCLCFFFIDSFIYLLIGGTELRASCLLGRCSTLEPLWQPQGNLLKANFFCYWLEMPSITFFFLCVYGGLFYFIF
jgi:hypothetical protein